MANFDNTAANVASIRAVPEVPYRLKAVYNELHALALLFAVYYADPATDPVFVAGMNDAYSEEEIAFMRSLTDDAYAGVVEWTFDADSLAIINLE